MEEFVKALLILGTPAAVSATTSWLKRCQWKPERKRLLAGAVSFVFAALIAYADGRIKLSDLNGTAASIGGIGVIVLYLARAFYELYFEKTELNKRLESMGSDDSSISA